MQNKKIEFWSLISKVTLYENTLVVKESFGLWTKDFKIDEITDVAYRRKGAYIGDRSKSVKIEFPISSASTEKLIATLEYIVQKTKRIDLKVPKEEIRKEAKHNKYFILISAITITLLGLAAYFK